MTTPKRLTAIQRAQILIETETEGITKVSRKYSLSTRALYDWRTKYLNENSTIAEQRAVYEAYCTLKRVGMESWRDTMPDLLAKVVGKLNESCDSVDTNEPTVAIPLLISVLESVSDIDSTYRILDKKVPVDPESKVRPLWPRDSKDEDDRPNRDRRQSRRGRLGRGA